MEAPSLKLDGSFTKAEEFERIWVAKNVNYEYGASYYLTDNEYIDYHIWQYQNSDKMYEKHLPNTMVMRGDNPNIIFHGHCLGCISQRNYGIDRCKGCQHFRANSSKPNLFINGEESSKINGEALKRLLGS